MTPEEIFRRLYLIRRVEEEIARVYPSDKIQSPIHLSIGQELASVAVCAALRPDDKVFGSYRSHALYLAKGGDLNAFVAELYGKVTGCAKGKGGSMHLVEEKAGLLGTSAIVASLIPVAVGYAWGEKLQGSARLTACFFGDGATEEGCYFEALNFAALHHVPLLFVCENNGYAIHTPLEARQTTPICDRVRAFGIPALSVSSYDGVFDSARGLLHSIADGSGSAFLEVLAPRIKEHVGPGEDWDKGYRTLGADLGRFGTLDPVAIAGDRISSGAREKIERDVDARIRDAFTFAEQSAVPGPEELMADLYG